MNQNKWNKKKKFILNVSKNVRYVSIFHISSCQTTCQGKNPNKLNNNFLIKLNYYFRFIFIWFFGRQIAFEHWAFKTRVRFANRPTVSTINRLIPKIKPKNTETDRTTPTYSHEIMRSLSYQWRHQYGLDGMHE